jgi:uncharacterized membrane protein YhaH (DUF805 family)
MELLAQSSTYNDPSGAAGAAIAAFGLAYAIFILALLAFYVFIAYMIVKRAGYNPWLALLILVPLVNFVMVLIFAFSEWPIQRENRELRAQLAGQGGAYAGGYAPPPPSGPPMTTG